MVGKTLRDANLRQRFEINVIGIRSCRSSTKSIALEPPQPDYVIGEGDTLLLVGAKEALNKFLKTMD